jgi:hypothetical protein
MATRPAGGIASDNGREHPFPLPADLLRELGQALQSIRYGTVELVIHDGRVVQLERREKVRFQAEVSKHTK